LFPPEKMIGFHFGLPGHFGRPTLQMTSTFKKRVTIAPDAHPPLPMDLHAILLTPDLPACQAFFGAFCALARGFFHSRAAHSRSHSQVIDLQTADHATLHPVTFRDFT
jgi:hypothetical protein